MSAEKSHFIKYCYWMDKSDVEKLKTQLDDEQKNYALAVKLPCEALKAETGIVAPEVWNLNCRHDAAPWYYASKLNGKYLVVSDNRLSSEYEALLEVIVKESDFTSESYPSKEEIKKLADSPKFKEQRPEGWLGFPEDAKTRLATAFKNNVGIDDSIDDIFKGWDAIHANFMEGKYTIEEEGKHIPYTIADTNHTGSCCVELFNIVGSEFKTKLVKPCLGAKIMKAL